MVKENEESKYECPYCYHTHDSHSDALDCAQDCLLKTIKEPEEVDESKFSCEMCGDEFSCHDDAGDCEQEHIENNDKLYQEYLEITNKEKLAKAAAHPEQLTLLEVCT